MKGFVDDEIAREDEAVEENRSMRRRWEKMNGGIEEEEVAIQVAMMMSREEEERRQEVECMEDVLEDPVEDLWLPGRRISFGSTSARSLRGSVDEHAEGNHSKQKTWESMNGGIEEEDIALQVAMMMSREEEQRRREMEGQEVANEEPLAL
jgi:hypothetical protein